MSCHAIRTGRSTLPQILTLRRLIEGIKEKQLPPSELFYKILQNFIKFCKFLHDFMKYFLQTSHFYKIINYFVKLCMFL